MENKKRTMIAILALVAVFFAGQWSVSKLGQAIYIGQSDLDIILPLSWNRVRQNCPMQDEPEGGSVPNTR